MLFTFTVFFMIYKNLFYNENTELIKDDKKIKKKTILMCHIDSEKFGVA